jgi:hypothetical protein
MRTRRGFRRLLAALVLAALGGCQVYEDAMPWTWHFAKDPETGETVFKRDANVHWCRDPQPLKQPAAEGTETSSSRPATGFSLRSSPAVQLASQRRPGPGSAIRTPKGLFRPCGRIDGRVVYRRVLPSEQVAEELGAASVE